jgi:Zn-dependent peptidase ImmA (M78 family)
MSNPSCAAKSLLDEIGWNCPTDLSVEEIAWASGLIVQRKAMEGSDGRILMKGDTGIISINSSINYQPKINYIIAHEIGHARLHNSLQFFVDNNHTLEDWYANGAHEKEANEFAAELLMPADLFKRKVSKQKLSLGLIEQTANYFGTSKTATFLRYREHGEYPVMIIFIENGIIKWKQCSTDFPFQWLVLGTHVPSYSVAGDQHFRGVVEKEPAKVDAIEWFAEDYKAQRNLQAKLWEQCFPVTSNGILTCLWTT